MRLIDFLDKGASLGPDAVCLRADEQTWSYAEVRVLSARVAAALERSGVLPGDKVAILSANDPIAFSCVFGISRAGAVWCPINPRSEAGENQELLQLFDCAALIYQAPFEELVASIAGDLPLLRTLVCLDGGTPTAIGFDDWLGEQPPAAAGSPRDTVSEAQRDTVDDVAMIAGTGGTTGRPKGVQLTGSSLESMSAITLMDFPFEGRPVYLAMAPLTHAAGVLCFPIMLRGGEVVVMRKPDVGAALELIGSRRVTHVMMPPTIIYLMLDNPMLDSADLTSLQCFWYGAAPMSTARLQQALERIGPVMAQFFGQTEVPMMVTTMAPRDHFRPDGSIFTERLSAAGRAASMVQLAIADDDGVLLPTGERGEVVVRGSLVMPGYYKNPAATAEVTRNGWHRTGDIGYLDADNFLYIVDRAKDMIISGGFNVYSAEVEQALMEHPDVLDCAVVGLPDEKWGERVTAVVQVRQGRQIDADSLRTFVRDRIGGVKSPKQVEIWTDLPRSKVGKVLKRDIRDEILRATDGDPR